MSSKGASDACEKRNRAIYKYPRVVEFVEELPKTVSGKIRRIQIRTEDAKQ